MNQSTAKGNRGRILRLCLKELRETLRDRRTVVTLILMPLLVYPILSMTLNRFLLSSGIKAEAQFLVGVSTVREADWLVTILNDPSSRPPQAVLDVTESEPAGFAVLGPPDGAGEDSYDPVQALEQQWIDIYVQVEEGEAPQVKVLGTRSNANSQAAQRILLDRLLYFNRSLLESTLQANKISDGPQLKIDVEKIGQESQSILLASVVPLVLVLMTITGAVYPAIDLTAGERERGTMEALIASPVPRGAVLLAKYVAVVTVALLTAVANLTAMLMTLWASGLLSRLLGEDTGFPGMQFAQIFVLLIVFACFFSALLLALTSFARSFKEAQAYLIPLMLVSLAPGVLSLMPNVSLTAPLAVVPLLNIILLSREILAGSATFVPAFLAVSTTVAYAVIALTVAARLFGSDAVLRGSEMSFGAALKRPATTRLVPSLNEAAMTMALIVPIYFVVAVVLGRFAPQAMTTASIRTSLALNAMALMLVFGGLPLLAARYCRDRLSTTYRTRMPGFFAVAGGCLLGLTMWIWAHEVYLFGEAVGIRGLDPGQIERVTTMVERLRLAPLGLIILVIAATPAVVEELCFRGYLFSALEKRTNAATTIVVTALVFGLFHVVTGPVLLVERFLPTTMLGLVLGFVAWKSGSVWPGVLLHFLHNGLLQLVIRYKDQLLEWGIGVEEDTHLPAKWLIGGSLGILIGLAFVALSKRRSSDALDVASLNKASLPVENR